MTTNSNDVLELSPESNKSTDKRITKKDLKALFWRSFPLNIMWSFDRQMNVGFCYDMIPVIKRLYDKPEDRIEAYKRHLEFYNIQVTFLILWSPALWPPWRRRTPTIRTLTPPQLTP